MHTSREKRRQSLSPAANVGKPLGVTAAPGAHAAQLDFCLNLSSLEKLFMEFLGSNQDSEDILYYLESTVQSSYLSKH